MTHQLQTTLATMALLTIAQSDQQHFAQHPMHVVDVVAATKQIAGRPLPTRNGRPVKAVMAMPERPYFHLNGVRHVRANCYYPADLKAGDLITTIDGYAVTTPEQFEAVCSAPGSRTRLIVIEGYKREAKGWRPMIFRVFVGPRPDRTTHKEPMR